MKFLLLLSLLISSVYAEITKISVGADNELILTAKTCDELYRERDALCGWKKKVDHNFVPKEEKFKCKALGNKATLSIVNCLPGFTRAYQERKLTNHGPNCWGTAMSFKGMSRKPRFVWTEEMEYWMNSPLCRKLNPDEGRESGDIINVYGPEYIFEENLKTDRDPGRLFTEALYPGRARPVTEEGYSGYHWLLHSVTYISEDLVFGKDSPSKDDEFYYHKLNEVYARPREDVSCNENQSLSPYLREYQNEPKDIRGSKCDYFSLAHRCENFDDYFSNQHLVIDDQDLWKSIKALQEFQEKLFPLVVSSKKVLSANEISLMVSLADITMNKSRENMQRPGLEKNREMLLALEYFTAAAIKKSLEQAKLIKQSP